MNGILDEIEKVDDSKIYSKISMIIALVVIALIGYFILNIPNTIKASEALSRPPMIIVIAIHVFSLTGALTAVLSFIKKEPSTWCKWVGAIINILFLSVIIGSIIFARIV